MKRFTFAMLVLLLSALTGCGTGQSTVQVNESEYFSDTSAEDCYLCGGSMESLIPEYWGQNNVALISLNTFEIKPLGINRYSADGQQIEEYAGFVSFGGGGSTNGGFSANLMLEYDRGYAPALWSFTAMKY